MSDFKRNNFYYNFLLQLVLWRQMQHMRQSIIKYTFMFH